MYRSFMLYSVAAVLAGCSQPAPEENAPAAEPAVVLTGNPPPTAIPAGKVLVAGDWIVSEDGYGVKAAFSEAGQPARLMVRCDRATRQVFIDRPGPAIAAAEFSIIAGGERFILPMTVSDMGVPGGPQGMSAPVHPRQPILASMAVPASTFTLLGPGLAETEFPAAPGIARVIDTCLTA